jgi:hypothetical protein
MHCVMYFGEMPYDRPSGEWDCVKCRHRHYTQTALLIVMPGRDHGFELVTVRNAELTAWTVLLAVSTLFKIHGWKDDQLVAPLPWFTATCPPDFRSL